MDNFTRELTQDFEQAQTYDPDILCARDFDVNVLISGGDHLTRLSLARMLYRDSTRSDGRFVTCSLAQRSWRPRSRDTLFIEELKELTPAMQVTLMHSIGKEGAGKRGRPRVIAATADDSSVAREVPPELFYRLNIVHIQLRQSSYPRVM